MPHLQVQLAHYDATVWKSCTSSQQLCWSQQEWEQKSCYIEAGSRIWFTNLQARVRQSLFFSCILVQTRKSPTATDTMSHGHAVINPPLSSTGKVSWHRFHACHQLVGATINKPKLPHPPSPVAFLSLASRGHMVAMTTQQVIHICSMFFDSHNWFFFFFACVGNIDQNSKTEYKQFKGCNWSFVMRKCFQ